MSIITISRGSYSRGKAVAEHVAVRLGYTVISRDLLLEASDRFHVPEIKLVRAIHDAPGILDRLRHSRQAYIAYIRAALTERVAEDNVVYHGLAGHLLLKGIPHVFKVRISADLDQRVAGEMQREGIGVQEARRVILADDLQRRRWTKSLYGHDPGDSDLYDLVIRVGALTVEDAVDFICRAASRQGFQATPASLQKARDLALACRIKAALANEFPHVGVTSQHGNAIVHIKDRDLGGARLHKKIEALRTETPGLFNLEVHEAANLPPDAA